MAKSRVAVVGASGYGGAEIVRLLADHPCAEVTVATSGRSAGRRLSDECPWLATELALSEFQPTEVEVDFVFLCQESGFAMRHVADLLPRARVIDLSADFRLRDLDAYRAYYGAEHVAPEIEGAYGLPELANREEIAAARLVANPGCYPTASLLALMPLIRSGRVSGVPVIDAKSGVSGAGRSRKETEYLFGELDGSFRAYGVSGHRHTPEIEQLAGMPVRFTPHLLPVARGLHATAHVPVTDGTDLEALFRDFYKGEPFITLQADPPSIKQVRGSNRAAISVQYEAHTSMAIVLCVIDNLVKGAAGQAVQNMNLMLGIPETTGLPLSGLWP